MYSNKDSSDTTNYPTQWALNPNAYQNMENSDVDWASLAQQWIAMKEASTVLAPPPPPKLEEKGEAPMDVENADTANSDSQPSGDDPWSSSNNWGNNWNQWGWNSWSGPMDPKCEGEVEPSMPIMPPMMDGFPTSNIPPMQGYTTNMVPAPTFQQGYWTAPQVEQNTSISKSENKKRSKELKGPNRMPRNRDRDRSAHIPSLMSPMMMNSMQLSSLDAAKRKQLPAWIREGLEKMEREKQRAIEKEQEKIAREAAEKEKKRLEDEELERLRAEAGGGPVMPAKSKFESDSEAEDQNESRVSSPQSVKMSDVEKEPTPPPPVKKSKEEIMQEVMLAVRRSLTEILLEVTDNEIHTVCQDEINRYNTQQATRLNAMKASKSKALSSIVSDLGLGAYESSSGEDSADEGPSKDISDQQLQDIIRRKRADFEKTSRSIEAEVRRAEMLENEPSDEENGDQDDNSRSNTPDLRDKEEPPQTPVKEPKTQDNNVPERRYSKDSKPNQKLDGKRLDKILEERLANRIEVSSESEDKESSSTSDSESSSSDSSSESEQEYRKSKKSKRKRSSSSDSRKTSKRDKRDKRESERKSKHEKERSKHKKHDDYEKSRRSSRDYERSRDKYREDSVDRRRKRSKRSRSHSRESRRTSDERRSKRRDRSRDYDRYERSRDRRRSRSRHRR